MGSNLVVEIDVTMSADTAETIIADAAASGWCGVVIKTTQGARWHRPYFDSLIQDAANLGLHVGWLHYCEPGANSAIEEAQSLLGQLGAVPLGLGVWLEVDDLQGRPAHELADWLKVVIEAIYDPARPVAVLADPTPLALFAASLPSATRLVLDRFDPDSQLTAWATRIKDASHDGPVTSACYELASTRGLVPATAPQVRPVVLVAPDGGEEPPDAPGAATDAPGAAPVELVEDEDGFVRVAFPDAASGTDPAE